MDINKIKVFSAEDTDYITGINKEEAKKWYADNIGIDIEQIESFEEIKDLENGGFWTGELTLSEVISIIENRTTGKEIKSMRTSDGYYAVWASLKDEILHRYKDKEFEHCIICSSEY